MNPTLGASGGPTPAQAEAVDDAAGFALPVDDDEEDPADSDEPDDEESDEPEDEESEDDGEDESDEDDVDPLGTEEPERESVR